MRFDGRLRVATVDRRTGRRVMFGSPGAPMATVAEAVEASCTVPWLFAPVVIGGREYVDGGVWSPTNLDAAPAGRDTHVLCLNPTSAVHSETLNSLKFGQTVRTVRLGVAQNKELKQTKKVSVAAHATTSGGAAAGSAAASSSSSSAASKK